MSRLMLFREMVAAAKTNSNTETKFMDGIDRFGMATRVVCIYKNKQTPWPLVRERTIPTDRPPVCIYTHTYIHIYMYRERVTAEYTYVEDSYCNIEYDTRIREVRRWLRPRQTSNICKRNHRIDDATAGTRRIGPPGKSRRRTQRETTRKECRNSTAAAVVADRLPCTLRGHCKVTVPPERTEVEGTRSAGLNVQARRRVENGASEDVTLNFMERRDGQ
jgi:hypothetical protein